ncbi:MAG: polysaccharide pyruvyl transferase family protein [Anaerolineae bacterium]|nr:polysaccharide pyruvyl transferase family protein [Anaerolineae bacterium]
MPQPKISIIGGTIWGNRGAEAMLVTTIGEVRQRCPDAEFGVFSYYPAQDRALVQDPRVHIFDARPKTLVLKHLPFALAQGLAGLFKLRLPLPADLRFLRESQVLLDIGGITFNDGRLVFLLFNIFTILPAMLMRVPVVKLSQAMGPFQNPINRLLSKIFLGRCRHLFARGAQTADFLSDLGLPETKWDEAADIAMLYQPQYSLSRENEEKVESLLAALAGMRRDGERVIAFSPSVLLMKKTETLQRDYATLLLDLLQTMDRPHQRYLFFPNASRESSPKARNNDIIAVRRIRESARLILPEAITDRMVWVDFDINNAAIRRFTAAADLLLTSRFHAMVSGLVNATPTLVIGWSHKYHEVLSAFGMPDFAFDFSADPEAMTAAALGLLDRLAEMRAQLAAARPANQASAAHQFDWLQEHFAWKN